MDKLLRGVLVSSHAPQVKKQILGQLLTKYAEYSTPDMHNENFRLASELFFGLEEEVGLGQVLLRGVAKASPSSFLAYFGADLLPLTLYDETLNPASTLTFIHTVLVLKKQFGDDGGVRRDCNSMAEAIKQRVLVEGTDPRVQMAALRLFVDVEEARPPFDISTVCLKWLERVPVDTVDPEMYDQHVSLIMAYMHVVWEQGGEEKTLRSLLHVLQTISREDASPSFALSAVLEAAPESFVKMANWPMTKPTGHWFTAILSGLAACNRYSLTMRIIAHTAPIVAKQLWVKELREGAVTVLEHMTLGYQHDPAVFHSLIPELELLVREQCSSSPLQQQGEKGNGGEKEDTPEQLQKDEEEDGQHQPRCQCTAEQQEEREEQEEQEKKREEGEEHSGCLQTPHSTLSALFNARTRTNHSPSAGEDASTHKKKKKKEEEEEGKDQEEKRHKDEQEILWRHTREMDRVCTMVHALMQHFPGYPELYGPLLDTMEMCHHAVPTPRLLHSLIKDHAWMASSSSSSGYGSVLVVTDTTGSSGGHMKAGLLNLRNTCYLNSALQMLFATRQFRKALMGAHASPSTVSVTYQLQRVFAYLSHTCRKAHAPRDLLRALPGRYRSGTQQDASEFARELLDSIETELAGTEWKSLIRENFEGSLETTVTCSRCSSVSARSESFLDLALSFPSDKDSREKAEKEGGIGGSSSFFVLDHLLSRFLSKEKLQDDNMYYCERCGFRTPATKEYSVAAPPAHLILTLSRFAYDVKAQTRTKILGGVKYGETLELPVKPSITGLGTAAPQQLTAAPDNMDTHRSAHYTLYGVVMHSGTSAHHGHYYCYARDTATLRHSEPSPPSHPPEDTEENGHWFQLNDTCVAESSLSAFTSITESFKYDVPYMLFYKRTDTRPMAAETEETVPTPEPLRKEVIQDNNKFLTEQENLAKQQALSKKRKSQYLHTGSSFSFYRYNDDDEDDEDHSNGSTGYDKDREFGGRGGFGGGMPRLVS